MRIVLRILKSYDTQKIPSCFITLNYKNKAFTYSINTPAEVYKDWSYFKHSQSDYGFRAFYTRFDLSHFSGIFGLISILDGRESLNKFQFFGCNAFMNYFSNLRYCFGIKLLKMSAASFEKNDFDFVALSNKEQLMTFLKNYDQKQSVYAIIKQLFERKSLNVARDQVLYDERYQLYYYEDEALRKYAIDIYSESPKELQDKQVFKKFAFHVCEKIENKKGIDTEKLNKDIPKQFLKFLFSKGQIQVDNKIYNLSDYQFDEQNSSFLVLELQNEEEVEQFFKHSYLKSDLFKNIDTILHLSPKDILELPTYSQFIKDNSKQTHLITASGYYSEKNGELNYFPFSFLNFNFYHNKLFPQIIPKMNHNYFNSFMKTANALNFPIEKLPMYHQNVKLALSPDIIHIKHNLVQFQFLTPSTISFNDLNYQTIARNNVYQQLSKNLVQYEEAKKNTKKEELSKYFPEIITLGTSSSQATLFRNVSSYLVRTDENNSIMLDCGHSTIQQLRKQFGTEDEYELYKQVKNIKIIAISHHHSDHHYGILEFLDTRMDLLKKYEKGKDIPKILVLVPNLLYNYLQPTIQITPNINAVIIPHTNISPFATLGKTEYWKKFDQMVNAWKQEAIDNDDNMIDFQEDDPSKEQDIIKLKEEHSSLLDTSLQNMGLKKIFLFPIYHCLGSRSIKLEFQNGKTIVYSGDGRLNLKFKNIIQDANFLIHETTYSIDRKQDAKNNSHCIFDEVVEFAQSLNVKCLIASHFSTYGTENSLSYNIDSNDFKYKFSKNQTLENFINKKTIFANDHLIINEVNSRYLPLASRIIFKTYDH